MNISEIRIQNLAALIGDREKHGAVAEFSRKHNLDPAYVRQLLDGHRNMGEKSARNFEEKIGLDRGYLDREDTGNVKVSARFLKASNEARNLPVAGQEFLAAVIEQYLSQNNSQDNQ